MKFSTKAETLASLSTAGISADVLPQFRFTFSDWERDRNKVLDELFQLPWSKKAVVVRSSGIAEDHQQQSLAGHFDSVVNVSGRSKVKTAIKQVINSFIEPNEKDQIFVQPCLTNVKRSGVLFTAEPSSNAPYYVVNFSTTGSTEDITSGQSNESLIYIAKATSDQVTEPWLTKLLLLCGELEDSFGNNALDIEFAFDDKERLFLFQVRPLVIENSKPISILDHRQALADIHQTIQRLTKPHPYLSGEKSLLGVMPDWNPAEIIGIRPNPLALSLYKELVTDSTWAYQRNNYGYKQLRSFPLLVDLNGLPYIDVRVSFNSFIPADISKNLADKLVNFYIEQLEKSPEKHDKVEFDIIFSCFTLDVEQRLNKLIDFGFSTSELEQLRDSLKQLTNKIISPDGLWFEDTNKIEQLPARREAILNSELSKVEKIYWLLEDCKRYGTLPFAGLARAGFIAVQFLKSMVAVGILTDQDYESFMASLETVSSNMTEDGRRMDFDAFLNKYGHLRPGTYDILSPRYDQAPAKYFKEKSLSDAKTNEREINFALSLNKLESVKSAIEKHGLSHDIISLFNFIKGAIEGREYAKFVFSRSLSDAILLMEELGVSLGINKKDLAFANISVIHQAYSSSLDIKSLLQNSIREGKERYAMTKSIVLPPLITKSESVYQFEMPENEPNFITMKQTISEVKADLKQSGELNNKIVFIPSADPGFDWLFSHNISGLVTMFGGANSHMAIRAGELGIPAVIGAGKVLYDKWNSASVLELDAANRRVVVLR